MNPQPLEDQSASVFSTLPPSGPGLPGQSDSLAELIHPFPSLSLPEQPALQSLLPEKSFLDYYGLSDNPFADCVHPGFFYRTESHAEAFRSMMLAVEFNTSLGLVTGPSGTGKTLVSQLLLENFDRSKHQVILVLATPGLTKTGLLREILSELNLALPAG